MGGNNSKFNAGAEGEVLPAKIRPLLSHRLEEFRKRRNNGGGIKTEEPADGISKKQLVVNDNPAADDVNVNGNIEPVVRIVEKLSKVVPLSVSEPVEKCSSSDEEDDDNEEETGRLIGPGSPSFKIYCIDVDKRIELEGKELREKETTEYEEEKETIILPILHKKSPSADSNQSGAAESVNSKEDVKTERSWKKKGRKIKALGAMKKNLMNVKNLHMNRMNRMMGCTGNNDRRNLQADL